MFFNRFIVFGHRGSPATVLENTLESLRFACQTNVPAVEFDVMLTADGVPVLFHDQTLDRLAGRPERIDALTAEQLSAVRLKTTYAIPRFAEVLDLLNIYRMPMNVEIKPSQKTEPVARKTAQTVIAALKEKGLDPSERVLISSFSRAALHEVSVLSPKIERALLIEAPARDDFDFARSIGAGAVHVPLSVVSPDYVAAAAKSGLQVRVYTVNTAPEAMKVQQSGAAGVFSDKPQDMMKFFYRK